MTASNHFPLFPVVVQIEKERNVYIDQAIIERMETLFYTSFISTVLFDIGLAVLFALAIRAYQKNSDQLRQAVKWLVGILAVLGLLSLFGSGFVPLLAIGIGGWISIRLSQKTHPRFRYQQSTAERETVG
ncbi:MAG: hypothetical protein AAF206_23380 [Bacteroidota bacterium]